MNPSIKYTIGVLIIYQIGTCFSILDCSTFSNNLTNITFNEPALVKCFNVNNYEFTQLPLVESQNFSKFYIDMQVNLTKLYNVTEDGLVSASFFFAIGWYDYNRIWDQAQIPLQSIPIDPNINKIWVPKLHYSTFHNDHQWSDKITTPIIPELLITVINSSGYVQTRFSKTISFKCAMNPKLQNYFPIRKLNRTISFYFPQYTI